MIVSFKSLTEEEKNDMLWRRFVWTGDENYFLPFKKKVEQKKPDWYTIDFLKKEAAGKVLGACEKVEVTDPDLLAYLGEEECLSFLLWVNWCKAMDWLEGKTPRTIATSEREKYGDDDPSYIRRASRIERDLESLDRTCPSFYDFRRDKF